MSWENVTRFFFPVRKLRNKQNKKNKAMTLKDQENYKQ